MYKTLIIIIFLFISQYLIAQNTDYPKGAYMSYSELMVKKPSEPFMFNIEKRTASEIKMYGGADYKITSQEISKKYIKKEIYAISTGDTLYINCYKHYIQNWYAKVISEGDYLIFFGPISDGEAARLSSQSRSSGAAGGAITGAKLATIRYLYILDSSFGVAKPLNRGRMTKTLEPYPYLLNEYNNEPNRDDEIVMLDYLIIINEE